MKTVVELTNKSRPELLQPDLIRPILHALGKEATEQIRRTRLLAADVFASLIFWLDISYFMVGLVRRSNGSNFMFSISDPAIPSVDQRD